MKFRKSARLLAVAADPKTVKGQTKGVLTGILYLAPHMLSGFQVCPKASEGCKLACLYTAGRGVYTNTQESRIGKTRWFFMERDSFMERLVKDIERLIKNAKALNMAPAVRLNGTSDIAWEKIKVVKGGIEYRNLMEAYPEINFYDYTKILGRKAALKLPNYHLTFSLSETNDKEAVEALGQGYNVAVVLNVKRKAPKPKLWSGYKVIDGDESDVRFMDGRGNIVALTAKGRARRDTSGFVRQVTDTFR